MLTFIESPAFVGYCERALAVLADSAAKGAVLLALAWLIALGLRRSSAAARHLVWALALCGLLLLPALSLVLPQWQLSILPRVPQAAVVPREPQAPSFVPAAPKVAIAVPLPLPHVAARPMTPAPSHALLRAFQQALPELTLGFWLLAAWLTVALLALVPLLAGLLLIGRLIRRSSPLAQEPWPALHRALSEKLILRRRVRLLRTSGSTMPMAVGVLHPAVLLPAEVESWSPEKRQAVLLHELAHIRRGDWLIHILSRLACVIHWFNPLAWVALRNLQNERERACDDLVLAVGTRPATYAEELLDIARTMRAAAAASTAAIPMARNSQLEVRLLAILDHTRNRSALTRRIMWAGILLLAVIMLPLATAKLVASQEPQHQQVTPSETTHTVLEAKRTRLYSATLAEFKPLWHDAEGRDQFISNGSFGFEYRGSLEKLITSLDDLQFNGEHLIHRLKAVEATPPDLARLVVEVRWIAPASMELEDRIRALADSLGFKVEKIIWDNAAMQRAENDVTVMISDATTVSQASTGSAAAPISAPQNNQLLQGTIITSAGLPVAEAEVTLPVSMIDALAQLKAKAAAQPVPPPQNPDWAKKFYQVYRLEDGEVLKRIASPFIPERLDYYRVEQTGQAKSIPGGPDMMVFRWDTKLKNAGLCFGSVDKLSYVIMRIGLLRYEFEGVPDLLKLRIPGDWIVRNGTPKNQLLAALEKIVNEQAPKKIQIVKRRVERETVVVRGKYNPHLIEHDGGRGMIQLYVDQLNLLPFRGGSGGSGPLKKFIEGVGSQENCWMIDETDSSVVPVSWQINDDSIPKGDQPLAADKLERLLKNLAHQTGLEFKKEKRQVEVWMVEEAGKGR